MMFIRLQLKLLINLVGNSLNGDIRWHNELSKLWFHYETKKVRDLLQELCDIPPIIPGFTEWMRAKILAETGALERFAHWRQLVAYAGLKIRMRRSGKYRGKDRITKKGRVLLRKLLGQAAFLMIFIAGSKN
ncbi:MAG: IS110 family transposase [Chitinophagales bacterium]